MQKLWLKDFEHRISPHTWELAEALAQAGSVKNLREIEKHFWVALVETDEGNFEAEVILTPHKVKAFACECFAEGRRLICPHVAATLLKIRQFLQQKEIERQDRAAKKETVELARYTVQAALESASPEDLSAFVREYARHDRDFALALKTRFAGRIGKTENPYALVLGSVLPKDGAKTKFSEADFKRLHRTADSLVRQANDALLAQDFRLAFQIAATVFQKVAPIDLGASEARKAALSHLRHAAYDVLRQVQQHAPSPELRENAWDFLFQFGTKNILPVELERQVLQLLSQQATENACFEKIRDKFYELPFPSPAFVLHLFLAALASRNMPEAAVRVLEDYRHLPDALMQAFRSLQALGLWEAATQVGEQLLAAGSLPPQQSRETENALLGMAERTNDAHRQSKWLRKRFLLTGSREVFDKLRSVSGGGWAEERAGLLRELGEKGDVDKMAAVLASDADLSGLKSLLAERGHLKLLQRHENQLLAADRAFVKEQYVLHLGRFLQEHFGAPASQSVRGELSLLYHKGESELTAQIVRELAALFPERGGLPAELAELFPKSARREMLR